MRRKPSTDNPTLKLTPGVEEAPSINPNAEPKAKGAQLDAAVYVEGILRGNRMLLSRAITLAESTREDHQRLAQEIIDLCLPHTGSSLRIGITGVPGVGKSTFIEAFGTMLLAKGHRLAVLAIDPSSTRTRGSILGDKTRMPSLAAEPNAYIRPSPTGGSLGGVAQKTRETMLLCEAAGFDLIFIETVGVGQSEVAVHSMVDFFLLLALAGAGDELQGIKRGIVEMADGVVITKSDGRNLKAAQKARGEFRNALHLYPVTDTGWHPPVLLCSALTGKGLDEIWGMLQQFVASAQESLQHRRKRQALFWMRQTLEQQLKAHFFQHPAVREALLPIEQAVAAGTLSPTAAAAQLLRIYRGESE